MKRHCWRNPRLEEKKEKDRAWPELESKNQRRRYDAHMRVGACQTSQNLGHNLVENQLEISNQIGSHLSHCDFPELGKTMSRKKSSTVKNPDAIPSDNVVILKEERDEKIKTKKYVKRSERANLFRINIQQVLENQRSLRNTLAEKKIKCCGRIVETKSNKIYLAKAKSPSKMKQIIINERKRQKEIRRRCQQLKQLSQIEPVGDVQLELNIGGLKIVPDAKLDLDYGLQLSGLNLLGNNYRDVRSDSLVDTIVENRIDISQRLKSLIIDTNDEINVVEDDLRHDVANMKINELSLQTGICLNDVNRALNLNSEGRQILENPAFQTFRGSESSLRYSRKFREYCTNMIPVTLNEQLETFVSELFRLQKKLYEKNNVKGRYKRRFYTGFNEVDKQVNLRKIKFVIIVPDLEKIEIEGGLNDAVSKLIGSCRKQNIPICFGLSRRKLGYLTHKRGIVSCIGVSNFSGIEEKLEIILNHLVEAKNEFRTLLGELNKLIDVKKIMNEDLLLFERINTLLKILATTT